MSHATTGFRMTVAGRVYLGVGALGVALLGLALFSQWTIQRTRVGVVEFARYPELEAHLGDKTVDHFKWAESLSAGTLLLGKEFKGKLDPTQCDFGKWYYSYDPEPELEGAFRKVEGPHKRLHASGAAIVEALKEGRHDEAKAIYQSETIPALAATQEAIGDMRKDVQALVKAKSDAILRMQDRMGKTVLIVYLVIMAGLIVGAVALLARPIRRNLAGLTAMFEGVRRGDLTTRAQVVSRDDLGALAEVANTMVAQTQEVLARVAESATTVASAAGQLSSGSEQIASGAQEQASSLEETAASLEEITSTVKQNADNAQQANQLANGAREVAEKGGRVVSTAVEAMSEINRSSKKIADIILTIDEIAFQTNLLALNAAVEAARAGEQGRGFAVVASEVRNLAQRSATAAKEIKGLIQDSVRKVEGGTELVNQSGQTLNEIVTSVKRVTDIVAEIAAASREQSAGIDQVNKAVTQMDQVTQSNASQTEELNATAEGLATQAQQLQQLVSRFKLETASVTAAPVVRTAPARPVAAAHAAPRRAAAPAPAAAAPAKAGDEWEKGFEEY